MVSQIDQDGPQGHLQEALGHLVVADHMGQALLSCCNDSLIRTGQMLEEHLDDLLTKFWKVSVFAYLDVSFTAAMIGT